MAAAKAQMERLKQKGDDLGSWAGKKVHRIEFLYEQADKLKAAAYAAYQESKLEEAYILFLRFGKFFELICDQPRLKKGSPAFKKCRMDLFNSMDVAEEVKEKLLLKFGAAPAVAKEATAPARAPDNDVDDILQRANLEARFNKLCPTPPTSTPSAVPAAAAAVPASVGAGAGGTAPNGNGAASGDALTEMDALAARMAKLMPAPAPAPAPPPAEDPPMATAIVGTTLPFDRKCAFF